MKSGIELPDYLPSRYKSWLHLYIHLVNILTADGSEISDHTEVNLIEKGFNISDEDQMVFYQKFPVYLIKSRALDYILNQFPEKKTLIEISQQCTYFTGTSDRVHHALDKLLDIADQAE